MQAHTHTHTHTYTHTHTHILTTPCTHTHTHTQIPAFTDHIPLFDSCSTGIGYALLVTVPSFYIMASFLFILLGVVIHVWHKRMSSSDAVYSTLENESQSETEDEKEKNYM